MGIGYIRAKKVIRKECEECGTVWADDQIYDDGKLVKHGYGVDNCPFCHAPWEQTITLKIPKLVAKRDKSLIITI